MRRTHREVGYVQSGLILHLDALLNMGAGNPHSNSTTTWYDLSSSANNVSLVSPSWSADYLTFAGSTRGATGANLNLSGKNQFTAEVLFRSVGTQAAIVLEQTTNYNNNVGSFIYAVNAGNYSKKMYFGVRKSPSATYIDGGFNATINDNIAVMQYDDTANVYATELEGYLDAVKQTLQGDNKNTTDTNMISAILYLGARGAGVAPFYGSIRAIRIYNRKLSLQELQQNKLEDFRRYGIIK